MDHTFDVRFQFDRVGSRQCTGCLSKVWELVKSFGNMISLGGGRRVNGVDFHARVRLAPS